MALPQPLLFLSHAGVDTDAALDLARRIEDTAAAREAGLRVWIDQRDLAPGRGWQQQLEDVIYSRSTAFAVYIGARGVINWVEAEVRVALSRATNDATYPFISILVDEARSTDLPVFARRYQAVRVPTTADPELVQGLLAAVLHPTGGGPVAVVEHPFVGLASFGEETAELFHGRGEETQELVERLHKTNLVMIVGDSGSGKSSLARAGLLPRFRGGAFADISGERPDPTFWQIIGMRPQGRPFERLVDAVSEAATKAGIGAQDRGVLLDWVRTRNAAKVRDAIRDSSPSRAKALLLVDQFEELWTLSGEEDRHTFIEVLLGVAENAGMDCRLMLTMRRDYYNLCTQFPALFDRLEAPESPSKYPLRRMTEKALCHAIVEPLKLTEYRNDPSVKTFATAVLKDVGDRPGDLALVEMALAEAWRYRGKHQGRLLDAYIARGRVAGALANAADDMFNERLAGSPLDLVKGVFVRLVRLGDTGGTTRRVARRTEFTETTWPLVQKLAGGAFPAEANGIEERGRYVRLVAIAGEPGEETVEIAHETLATQWPRYQNWLEDAAPEKRVFDLLIDRASQWKRGSRDLAQGTDLENFLSLRDKRAAWLSEKESWFVEASEAAEEWEKARKQDGVLGIYVSPVRAPVALLLGGFALTLPVMHDMLAFLSGGDPWPAMSFQVALIVLGASAWFWSRAALRARFGIYHRNSWTPGFDWTVFTWLPRCLLLGSFLIGAVIAFRCRSPWALAGAIVLGTQTMILTIIGPQGPTVPLQQALEYRTVRGWIQGGTQARLRALLWSAPFGALPAMTLLVLGLVSLAVGVIDTFTLNLRMSNHLAAVFPGPAIIVLLLGLAIGPLTVTTFVCDGMPLRSPPGLNFIRFRRPPVLTVILLYVFVLVPSLFYVHTVRVAGGPPAQRQPLDALFRQWTERCAPGNGPIQPVIVAVSGGATQAGLWGAAVLDRVLQAQRPGGPTLFAVSSVSGGSLGVAAAMTLLSLEDVPCEARGLAAIRPSAERNVPLAGDALGPLLGGWLLNDIPRSLFTPVAELVRLVSGRRPNGGDSAEAIEHGFEELWAAARPIGAPGWDQPFLSLFYIDQTGTYRPGMPLWFANGTDAATTNRVITTPIAVRQQDSALPWPFQNARDFHNLMGADVSIATAINNTARFPYLEPFGDLLPLWGSNSVGSLVDGGHFENEGLLTALELANWLARHPMQGRPVRPIIVQATVGGVADVGVGAADVVTCGNASDAPMTPNARHSAWQVLAPLVGLYRVTGGFSAVLLRQARDQLCDEQRPRFVHFYLPADDGDPIPLNWGLSDATARFIWSAFTDKQVANAAELRRLDKALAPDPSLEQ